MSGVRAPSEDEHRGSFPLQLNVCTVVFLHVPGISGWRHGDEV